MALTVLCTDPRGLLNEIKGQILAGSIETWQVDADGDFTHSPAQWNKLAWFRPRLQTDRITFNIFPRKGEPLKKVTYAVYHGRFIEMLLAHFDAKFSSAWATALATTEDYVKPTT